MYFWPILGYLIDLLIDLIDLIDLLIDILAKICSWFSPPYFRQILGILEAPRPMPLTKQPGTSFIFPDSGWIWLDKLQNDEYFIRNL